MDYRTLLDDKTKRRVLLDAYEDQKNRIQYYVDEHEPGEAVPMLEKLVDILSEFVKENIPEEQKE